VLKIQHMLLDAQTPSEIADALCAWALEPGQGFLT